MSSDSETEHETHDGNDETMNHNNGSQIQFEEDFNRWLEQMESEIESTRRSEQLTEKDYSIRINAKD